jgi:hypothetical protein
MNVNSVTSLFPSYLSPLNNTATGTTNPTSASSVQQQADVSGLSPAAQFLNQLQQLQTQSPQQFQAVISQLTGQLNEAATTASNNGNTTQANQLTGLANEFQSAASGGALPTAQQLQQAGIAGHHRHSGGQGSASSQSNAVNAFQAANSADSQNQGILASIFGSINPTTQSAFA